MTDTMLRIRKSLAVRLAGPKLMARHPEAWRSYAAGRDELLCVSVTQADNFSR